MNRLRFRAADAPASLRLVAANELPDPHSELTNMKTTFLLAGLLALGLQARAEISRVIERGPNHRALETVREIQTARGPRLQTNQIVEVAGGMHRWTEQGWVTTDPKVEVFGDNAVVRNLAYGAIVAGNLATPGALDFSLPDGQRLTGHLLGLALTEGNRSVLIAEVKDCAGVIGGPEQNEITFADAFTDFSISVKYIFQRDRISQTLTLNQQLPHPATWGLTENAVLEVLSEWTAFPELRKEPRDPISDVSNEHISFASMEFVTGKAFSLGEEANSVLVAKTWELFEGNRSFLCEKIPWKSIAPELAKLPPVAKDWRDNPDRKVKLMARNQLRLPPRREARAAIRPKLSPASLVATAPGRKPAAYVIDWEAVSSVSSNLWKGDTTYYISGQVTIKTNIFEPNCVIKFAPTNNAKFTITGPATFLTANYMPLIITARDDHSVGDVIGANTLSGYYGVTALEFDYGSSGVIYDVHDVRVSYANEGISFPSGGRGHTNRNVQLINCGAGFRGYNATFQILNGLFSKMPTAFSMSPSSTSATGIVQNVTFNQCTNLDSGLLTLFATNSLFVAVTNITSFSGAYNGTNSDPSAAFQIVGAGANYLAVDSSFRDAGTTNIDSGLLASLKQLTTYPPVVMTLTSLFNTTLTLSPQAGRDSDGMPDLGFHYAPLDFALGGVYLTNSTITITNGAAIATFSPTNGGSTYYGIGLDIAAQLYSEGSPTNLNRIVRYNTVQEQTGTSWSPGRAEAIFTSWAPATPPSARFRFTQWSVPALDTSHLWLSESGISPTFLDCQFYSGQIYDEYPTVNVTNCLLHRVGTEFVCAETDMNPTFQNCLFYGGTLSLVNFAGGTWTFKDNVFDKVQISQTATLTHDYNGYVTNSANQILTSSGANDRFTNNLAWQTGALGRFYQPTPNIFIGKGSTNADVLGLYHYTVLTSGVKETNSVVDIGFHYVATDTNGNPTDSDGDGLPDYLEDADGDGVVDSGESSFSLTDTDGDGVSDYLEWLQGRRPKTSYGTIADTNGVVNLKIFTPNR
jgi:hypothetical protein